MKLFVWDFHGVLEKGNEFSVKEVTNRVLKEFNIPRRLSDEDLTRLYGQKWIDYFRELSPNSSEEELEAMTTRAFEISRKEKPFLKYIKPMDNAEEVLRKIKERGGTNIVLSNSSQIGIVNFTNSVGLTYLFDTHIGIDNHLEKEIELKTKAQAIRDHINGKNVEKIVVIGDHPKDIETGHEVNAITYLFSETENFPEADAHFRITDLRGLLKEL